MNEYLLLMHQDALDAQLADDPERWAQYLARLRASGQFDGGSSIGVGEAHRKNSSPRPGTAFTGFLRIRARDLEGAREFLIGNPTFEAGGTVEIFELPAD